MKKIKLFLAFFLPFFVSSQVSYLWNGSTSSAWNVTTNWTPNGVPSNLDNVTIVTGANNCVLNANTQITNITVTSGVLDLGGLTLTPTGNLVFTAGTVMNGTLSVNAGAGNTANFSNTTLNANAFLKVISGAVTINGGTYHGPVYMNQTGAVQTSGTGNATFNSTFTLTNSGTNNLRVNGNCTYNGVTTFSNTGSGYFLPELTTGSTYNSTLHIVNTSAASLRMCYLGTTNFNSNIFVNNTGAGNIEFCEQATAVANLNSGNTISVGSFGFTQGRLNLRRFNQLGATAQNLVLTGSSYISITNSCVFNGPLNTTAPSYVLSNSTYQMPVSYTKNGSTNDATNGGNVYNSTLTVNHSGSGYLSFAYAAADIYNGDVYSNNNGSERIIFGHNSAGNQFNGNFIATQIGSSQGTAITWNAGATATMAAGKTIQLGSGGFNVGFLYIRGLTHLGTVPLNLTLTGSSSVYLGPASVFSPSVSITAPDIYAQGGTYNSPVVFLKNGGTNNHNSGNLNIFNSTLDIQQQSNTGYFMLGYNANDQFNDNVTVSSIGTGGINLGWVNGTGLPTLASGKTLSIGSAGFSAGYLRLGGFTQLGSTPINLTLTGSSSFYISQSSANSTFGGSLTVTAPDLYLQGGTFNGATSFIKTGGTNNHNNGYQNIFNSTLNIDQQSNGGFFLFSYYSNDIYNDDITVTENGSGGVALGWTGGPGSPTLAAGKTILTGAGGITAGYLRLGSFVQLGTAPINLTLTGSSYFQVVQSATQPCVFGGSLTVVAPDLYIQGGIFNGPTEFTKTGGTSNHNAGLQNIFNSTLAFNQQSSSGYFMLSYNSNDLFNDDITLTSTGSGGTYFGWPTGTGSPTLAAGKTIFVGSAGFSAGFLSLHNFKQLGSAPINLNFTGTTAYMTFANNSLIGGNLTATAPGFYFNGATFNGLVNCDKNGPGNYASSGGNTFQAVSSFTNSGSGYLMFANGTPDIFNSDVKFSNNGSSYIYPSYNSASNMFNGNIEVNSSNTALGIYFGANNGTSILAAAKTISVGTPGYAAGYLILRNFTQLGSAAVNLNLASTSTYLQFGPSSTIGGNLTSSSPGLYFNGCTFNGTTNSIKTGSTNDPSIGNNVFNASASFTNSGSGYLMFANGNPDIFNSDAKFSNNGSSYIYPSYSSASNMFNGNIEVNSSATALGIYFGANTGTSILAAAKTISVGTPGYAGGYLILRNFTQLGSAAVNLNLASTSTYLQFGPSSTIGGNLVSSSPGLYFNGCTFNGTTNSMKTGSSSDQSIGNNVFNASASFTNSGTGYLMFGNGNLDQFNSSSNFRNTGSSHIYVSYNSVGNVFVGPATFSNTPSSTNSWIYVSSYLAGNSTFSDNIIVSNVNGGGVYFGSSTGCSTLTAGKIISVGSGGFNSGQFILKQFTQVGSTAQSFTTTGSSILQYGPSSKFDGDVTTASPGLLFNGCTYNGLVNCLKNGSSNDAGIGANVFNAASSFTNTGSGYLMFGNGSLDQFNSTSSFNNLGSSHIYVAHNSVGNVFGGAVTLNNSPTSTGSWIYVSSYQSNNATFNGNLTLTNVSGAGIIFGNNTGYSTLSSGNSISIGSGGFNSGQLIFRQFTQLGSTAQNFTTTGTSIIQYGPTSTFNGSWNTGSGGVLFNSSVFNGNITAYKTGASNDASTGGNTFNGVSVFSNLGTGYLLMTNTSGDSYNGDVQFERNNTGQTYPNYNTTGTYFGNVTVKTGSTYTITFGANNGIATFSGTTAQSLGKTVGSENPTFTRMVMNKSSNSLTLNTKVNISNTLTLSSGLINTTSSNVLYMNNNSGVGIGNTASYINGPMSYEMALNGTRTLNMPVGKSADWRPAILVAAHNNATSYTYNSELFNASANALGWTYAPTINLVSLVHYWDINRVLTSSNASAPTANVSGTQTITLFYGANDGVPTPSALRIAKNTNAAPTAWIDIGGTGSAVGSGSITSTSSPSNFNSYSRFTLANHISGNNPLPIELLSFTATKSNDAVELKWSTATETNNDHFEIERSLDGVNFDRLLNVQAYGTGNSMVTQSYSTLDKQPYRGINYYRLKQVDKDGQYSYTNMVSVNFDKLAEIKIYPNPFGENIKIDGLNGNCSYVLVNAIGQKVKTGIVSDKDTELITSDLPAGSYIIQLSSGSDIKHVKLIKN